jgi:hypothetical protein
MTDKWASKDYYYTAPIRWWTSPPDRRHPRHPEPPRHLPVTGPRLD